MTPNLSICYWPMHTSGSTVSRANLDSMALMVYLSGDLGTHDHTGRIDAPDIYVTGSDS